MLPLSYQLLNSTSASFNHGDYDPLGLPCILSFAARIICANNNTAAPSTEGLVDHPIPTKNAIPSHKLALYTMILAGTVGALTVFIGILNYGRAVCRVNHQEHRHARLSGISTASSIEYQQTPTSTRAGADARNALPDDRSHHSSDENGSVTNRLNRHNYGSFS